MKSIDLAIIIPTLNEEDFIGKLLDSIAKQTVLPKEVVVVDAFSKDKTIEEIKKRQKILPQLKFYQIPKKTIARQRNLGVLKTTASNILFLDADTLMREEDVLENYLAEVEQRQIQVGAARLLPLSTKWHDKVYFTAMDLLFKTARPFWPMVTGMNLYFTREIFDKIGGFDEVVAVGEDFEIVQRAVKKGHRLTFIKQAKVHASVRRLDREGKIRYTLKLARILPRILWFGYRHNPIKYEFGNFKTKI